MTGLRPITELEAEFRLDPELVVAVRRIRASGATALDVQYSTDLLPDEMVWVAVAAWPEGREVAAGFSHDAAVDQLLAQREAAVARQQARPTGRIALGPVPQDVPAGSRCQFAHADLVWTAAEDLRAGERAVGDPATLRMFVDRS